VAIADSLVVRDSQRVGKVGVEEVEEKLDKVNDGRPALRLCRAEEAALAVGQA
jgi:hypothetical protein